MGRLEALGRPLGRPRHHRAGGETEGLHDREAAAAAGASHRQPRGEIDGFWVDDLAFETLELAGQMFQRLQSLEQIMGKLDVDAVKEVLLSPTCWMFLCSGAAAANHCEGRPGDLQARPAEGGE